MSRPGSHRHSETGSIAPAIPIIAMALLLLGGLGVDGSRQLNARGQAVAFAEEAARAGAQAQDNRISAPALDFPLARQRVDDYCAEILERPQVTECEFVRIEQVSASDARRLVVVARVSTRIRTTLLGMVGVHEMEAEAVGKARPYQGVSEVGGPSGDKPTEMPDPGLPDDPTTEDADPELPPEPDPTDEPTDGPTDGPTDDPTDGPTDEPTGGS